MEPSRAPSPSERVRGWFRDPFADGTVASPLRFFDGSRWSALVASGPPGVPVAPTTRSQFTVPWRVTFATLAMAWALALTASAPSSLVALFAVLPAVAVLVAATRLLAPRLPDPARARRWAACFGATVAPALAVSGNLGAMVVLATLTGEHAMADLMTADRITGPTLVLVVVVAPVVEELAKGLGLWTLARKGHLTSPWTGAVFALAVAGAFAVAEDVTYLTGAADEGLADLAGTFVARVLASPFAHPMFTTFTGVALGWHAMTGRRGVRPLGLVAAMAAHATWNGLASLAPPLLLVVGMPVFALWVTAMVALRTRGRQAPPTGAHLPSFARLSPRPSHLPTPAPAPVPGPPAHGWTPPPYPAAATRPGPHAPAHQLPGPALAGPYPAGPCPANQYPAAPPLPGLARPLPGPVPADPSPTAPHPTAPFPATG